MPHFYSNVSVNKLQFSENDSSFFAQVWLSYSANSVKRLLMPKKANLSAASIYTSQIFPVYFPFFAIVNETDFRVVAISERRQV